MQKHGLIKQQLFANGLQNKNFANFIEKHLCWSLFLIKLQAKEVPTQVFSCCEISKIFKKTFSDKPPVVASVIIINNFPRKHNFQGCPEFTVPQKFINVAVNF